MTEKRRALVTGGTRGIGKAIAEHFLQQGIDVLVTGTSESSQGPDGAVRYCVDFSDPDATREFVGQVQALGIDILVNNAGINAIGAFADIHTSDFDRIQLVNVRAPFLLCQAVMPHMTVNGWGRIVNVSSIFGVITKEYRASYSASKFALDGMTSALAVEAAPRGILANCVAPGFVDTDLTRAVLGEEGISELQGRVPIGRLGTVDEIATLVAWLAGPENTYLTGQNIVIDGGFTRV